MKWMRTLKWLIAILMMQMKDRTSFVIAHRLSTVRGADYIYVLDNGTVVEEGSHEHLLSISGLYAELCRTSFLDEQE